MFIFSSNYEITFTFSSPNLLFQHCYLEESQRFLILCKLLIWESKEHDIPLDTKTLPKIIFNLIYILCISMDEDIGNQDRHPLIIVCILCEQFHSRTTF